MSIFKNRCIPNKMKLDEIRFSIIVLERVWGFNCKLIKILSIISPCLT